MIARRREDNHRDRGDERENLRAYEDAAGPPLCARRGWTRGAHARVIGRYPSTFWLVAKKRTKCSEGTADQRTNSRSGAKRPPQRPLRAIASTALEKQVPLLSTRSERMGVTRLNRHPLEKLEPWASKCTAGVRALTQSTTPASAFLLWAKQPLSAATRRCRSSAGSPGSDARSRAPRTHRRRARGGSRRPPAARSTAPRARAGCVRGRTRSRRRRPPEPRERPLGTSADLVRRLSPAGSRRATAPTHGCRSRISVVVFPS